jgi:hypothetical protein
VPRFYHHHLHRRALRKNQFKHVAFIPCTRRYNIPVVGYSWLASMATHSTPVRIHESQGQCRILSPEGGIIVSHVDAADSDDVSNNG